jgi:hypothetical protein
MVEAQYHLQMRDVRSPEGVPVGDAITAAVIAELEGHADPLSHAILRGLEYLGTGETATRSAEAAARLADRAVGLTAKFGDVAGARAVGAWRATEGGRKSEYVLFAEFEHSLGRCHSLALFVRGGAVKHIGLMHSMSEFDPSNPFHPSAMEKVAIADASELMRQVLDRTYGASLAGVEDFRLLIAAARVRG